MLIDVVRVAEAAGQHVVARIASDVFGRLRWRDGETLLIEIGRGFAKGKIRFSPTDDDSRPARTVKLAHIQNNRARTIKFVAEHVGIELGFEIFSAPFEIDGKALTLDLSSIMKDRSDA